MRVTISIRPEIKKRMDAVDESVNWSGVASRAFENYLLELETKRMTNTIEEAAERLRASMEIEEQQAYKRGKQTGKRWVTTEARFKELDRLEKFNPNDSPRPWRDAIFENENSHVSTILGVMSANDNIELRDEPELLKAILWDDADKMQDKDFALGFVEGALETWEEIQRHPKFHRVK